MQKIKIVTVSSLEKIRGNAHPTLLESHNSMLKNEVFSFQIAFKSIECGFQNCQIEAVGDLNENILIRHVEYAPCDVAILSPQEDGEYYETTEPALLPDILMPIKSSGFTVPVLNWRSVFVTVKGNLAAGEYNLKFNLFDRDKNILGIICYKLTVIDKLLPKQKLIYTNWVHYDSICHYYNVQPFSDRFYQLLNSYIKNAVEHGMNMLYTPLFTPPLDTAIGHERLTIQLIDVNVTPNGYSFNFSKFKTFINKMKELGVEWFEFSHLFTQWGAKAAPKIMATVDGQLKQIFGWETDAFGEEYTGFLNAFLAEFVKVCKQLDICQNAVFHVSDEPHIDSLENYSKAANIIKSYIGNMPIIDAISDLDIYKKTSMGIPIPSINHIEPFLQENIDNLWAYYCTGQYLNGLSNRFICMPLQRTRIIGVQLYINDIKGFLHWGYNFYASFLSLKQINPYNDTSSGGTYQSGDAFIVYPGEDGAIDSIRHETMLDAWQDLRLLQALELQKGKEFVFSFLQSQGVEKGFTTYPKSAVWHILFRQKIHKLLTCD